MNTAKIMRPWTPIKLTEEKGQVTTQVWGRNYISGKKSFLEKITSQGRELLASPVRIVGTENDEEIQWTPFQHLIMNESDEAEVTVCSSALGKAFILNTTMEIAYDGCIRLFLNIMPQGRSDSEWFALGESRKTGYELSRLWLEIPLKQENALFYHVFPSSDLTINGVKTKEDTILQAGKIAADMTFPFKEQIYVSNDEAGLGLFFESDRHFQPESPDKTIELIRRDTEVLLRIRLLDSEPVAWKEKDPSQGRELFPISYKIGMMATPVKEYPENPYTEKNIHIDCYKKVPENYEDFLMENFQDTMEIPFDRYKRLGVTTLYIHEKWNDLQSSPFLTKKSADRLRLIVEEAHKRGIKVIPYFGYEISSLSPYWGRMGEKVMRRASEKYYDDHWYRYPYQRAPIVCYHSQWQDIFAEGIEKLMDEFHFDGIYLDGTIRPLSCMNEKHGCGWRDENGALHATYPVWAVRELMKKLYRIVDSRGGIINCHGTASFTLGALPYCHTLWEGEMIQTQLMHGEITEFPEGYYRSVLCGRNLGIPENMLCYSNPPVWNFPQALALSLLIGVLPKPNDSGEPLEIMSQIWRLFDSFSFNGAAWHPYYENTAFTISEEAVKISYYENNGKYLILCVNTKSEPCRAKVQFPEKLEIKEMCVSCHVEEIENGISFQAEGFDYAIIVANKY